jgi:peptide/nickel transport system permease protein
MACVPELGGGRRRLEAIPGMPPAVNDLPPGCAFADRCDRATAECRTGEITLDPHGTSRSVRCIHPVPAPDARAAE